MNRYTRNSISTNKKGDLTLSINAIVVLILAITMLSLGLAFMKGMFGKTTKQLADVGADIKNQMIEQLRTSSEKLTLNQEDMTIKKGDTKEIYFAIKNILPPPDKSFKIDESCELEKAIPAGSGVKVDLETFKDSRLIEQNGIDVQKIIVKVEPTSGPGTVPCEVKLNDGTYAKKSFFITVE